MMIDGFGIGLYSPRVAARIARIRYQSFQAWAKTHLLHPIRFTVDHRGENTYTFRDLLLIRLIVRLKAAGARPKAIRTALDTITLMSDGNRDAWMQSMIVVSSSMVIAVIPGRPEWNPVAASKGPQKMAVVFFPELIEELKEELVPPDKFPHVEIDPQVVGGAPIIKGTRISTRAVTAVKESGENPREAYPLLTDEQIANAEAYEEFLKVA